MTARLLDGDALAARMREEIGRRYAASALARDGVRPCLVTIRVGEHAPSAAYVARKHADCAELGFASRQIELPADVPQDELLAAVAAANRDPGCHGLLVQLPLPEGLDAAAAQAAVAPEKDVDGLHPVNLGRMVAGLPGIRPCTPCGIIALLRENDVPLAGSRVAIVGRGLLTGRPLALMLADPEIDAVPTLLHRGAGDISEELRRADIIVSAAGQPDLIRAGHVKPGAAVVGVGISYVDGEMVSDIAEDVREVAGHMTPRHGSVGAMTRVMLMANLLDAALASG